MTTVNTRLLAADARVSGASARQTRSKNRLCLVLAIAVALVVGILGCSSENIGEPTPYDRDDFTPIPGPPPPPVIFNGKFTVAGDPGPADQTIYAEFIHGGSPRSTTFKGEYVQVILGPVSVDDLDHGVISFYLGTRAGDHVKADQTWTWSPVNQPTNQVLDLSFPRMPES